MQQSNQVVREQEFRNSLADVLVILRRLGQTCNDIREVAQLVELAAGSEDVEPNDGQLRILMALMDPPKPQPQQRQQAAR